jgi:hypothetical protein
MEETTRNARKLTWIYCQMVYFQTKNPNLGKFWRVLQWKMLSGNPYWTVEPKSTLYKEILLTNLRKLKLPKFYHTPYKDKSGPIHLSF